MDTEDFQILHHKRREIKLKQCGCHPKNHHWIQFGAVRIQIAFGKGIA